MKTFLVFFASLTFSAGAHYNLNFDLKSNNFTNKAVSEKCEKQLHQYLDGLNNLQEWAWNMFDASPKLPYGILTGNALEFGNYDECLQTKYQSFDGQLTIKGKFCLAGLIIIIPVSFTTNETLSQQRKLKRIPALMNIENIYNQTEALTRSISRTEPEVNLKTVALSICIPDACKPSEVYDFLTNTLELGDVTLPVVANNDVTCETEDSKEVFSNVDLAFVLFLSAIICLSIGSSIYDAYTAINRIEPQPLLLAFSFVRNFKILSKNSKNPNRITCLDGLRVFSILWVIMGHRYAASQALPWVNFDHVESWKTSTYSQYTQGAPSAVDTFLFLTGFLTAMQFIKSQSKPKANFNVLIYYIHRYLRLTPAMAVIYFLHVSVYIHLGSGPMWSVAAGMQRDLCIDRWIPFFFYYQNYLNSNDMCLLHTWYLAMDMHIFILSPLILIPLVKFKKFMIKIGLPVLLTLSMICVFAITYIYKTQIFTQDYYDYYYYPTHTRISAWLVGIYAGTMAYECRNSKLNIHWVLNLFIWMCVIAGMAACIFTGNDVIYNFNRVNTAFYLTFHRPMWCVGLAWMVFACMKGRGGIFNWVLSTSIFQNLSKLTYSMYLVHVSILLFNIFTVRFPEQFSDYNMIHLFLGDVLQVIALALIWYLLFESPVAVFENVLLLGAGKKTPPQKGVDVRNSIEVKVVS